MTAVHAAERALVGAMLLTPTLHRRLIADGLRPEHLADERMRLVLDAMTAIADTGSEPSVVAVGVELQRRGIPDGPVFADGLTAESCAVGAIDAVVRQVREAHTWRTRHAAARALLAAVEAGDADALATAEQQLADAALDRSRPDGSPKARADRIFDRASKGSTAPVWPWPLRDLNRLTRGGMRGGQVTFLSGPTSHGKSVFADTCLESAASAGATSWAWINEMSREERDERTTARCAGVPMIRLAEADLAPNDAKRVTQWLAAGGPSWGLDDAAGWSAQDIARDIRYRRPDVALVDLLDELPLMAKMTRRETAEEAMRIFKETAAQVGCHLIVVGHMNRSRMSGRADIPVPTLAEIRESALLAARSHNVVFVWREQDSETGQALDHGRVILAKARSGQPGSVRVCFDGELQRWLPLDDLDVAVAA